MTPSPLLERFYQVGGSLPVDAPTYVQRQADEDLFQSLLAREFCYVFNARQMGKSSLRVRTMLRLQEAGVCCGVIDITQIGTQDVTIESWYAAMIAFLSKRFQLKLNFMQWWSEHSYLSYVSRLDEFLEAVLLAQIQQPIVIFIDEIDSVLSLKFPTDDFFALIRACYNRRADQPQYRRLTFVLLGVITPSELISDLTRTPFNVGQAIKLQGFQLTEAAPLLPGLASVTPEPEAVLERVLFWTGGQPFLTQKLCNLIRQVPHPEPLRSHPTLLVDHIIHTYILENWQTQDEPEHLKTITDRLLYQEQRSGRLLGLYQSILLHSCNFNSDSTSSISNSYTNGSTALEQQQPLGIPSDHSSEQTELMLTGLVEKRAGYLQVKNLIYQQVFNLEWVAKHLANLRPHSQSINAWITSGYADQSWLLRGQALREVLTWAQGKSLSDQDYQFLAASQELERQEVQKSLEAERLQEVEFRLRLERQRGLEQRRSLRRQRGLLGIVTGVMVLSIGLGLTTLQQSRQSALNEAKAIVTAAEDGFAAGLKLDALFQTLRASRILRTMGQFQPALQDALNQRVEIMLQRAALDTDEFNRLVGHQGAVLSVVYSPQGDWIATAGSDKMIKLWKPDGTLVWSRNHGATPYGLAFHPTGKMIAAGGVDGDVTLWDLEGKLLKPFQASDTAIWHLTFSPDGQTIATASADYTVRLWSLDGTLIKIFRGHRAAVWDVAFSPSGQTIASASLDGTIQLWRPDGTPLRTLTGHQGAIWAVAFNPNGQTLISASADQTLKLWTLEGTLLRTFQGHQAAVMGAAFSPDGQVIASSSADQTVRLWTLEGRLLQLLQGHSTIVRDVAFHPDGTSMISASDDNTARLWRTEKPFFQRLYDHPQAVAKVTFSPDSQRLIAVAGSTLKLWRRDGTLLKTLSNAATPFLDADFSPTQPRFASASADGQIQLWSQDGTLQSTLQGHDAAVQHIAFSPDGQSLISASDDTTIKLWQQDPQGQFQLRETFAGHQSKLWDVAFSQDGAFILAVDEDGSIWFWLADGATTPLFRSLIEHKGPVWGLAISPDQRMIASSSQDGSFQLWDRNGFLLKTLKGGSTGFTQFAFDLAGERIAAAGTDHSIKLWQQDGTLLATLSGHGNRIGSIAFSPDGTLLASGGEDKTTILWDLQPIFDLDLLDYSCEWMKDYLKTNSTVETEDRTLCNIYLHRNRGR